MTTQPIDDAELDYLIDQRIEDDEAAFEEQYAAEHPDDDYLGRPRRSYPQ